MKFLNLFLGRSLASSEDKKERVGGIPGVSVFGLDAFSSAAYGPEAALTVLIPLAYPGTREDAAKGQRALEKAWQNRGTYTRGSARIRRTER